MIVTEKKQFDEVLKGVGNAQSVFIVACGSCATKTCTADEKSVAAMKELLEKSGKKVTGSATLESGCDIRIAKRDLSKNEAFSASEAVVILACGAGSQAVEKITDKLIVPALNSKFIGTTERIGIYQKFCGACGVSCLLVETEGICPKARCAKSLVNGPCGGFINGKCETDQTKDCAWVLIFEKLKKNNKLDKFLKQYIKPQ